VVSQIAGINLCPGASSHVLRGGPPFELELGMDRTF
jgi:hypothetical protein